MCARECLESEICQFLPCCCVSIGSPILRKVIPMLKRVLAFIAIAYAAASAAWTPSSAKAELTRLREALTARMIAQGKVVDDDNLLELYALFKQATEGDKPAELSAGMHPIRYVQYKRWESKAGLAINDAVDQYKALVKALGDVE